MGPEEGTVQLGDRARRQWDVPLKLAQILPSLERASLTNAAGSEAKIATKLPTISTKSTSLKSNTFSLS